MKTRDDIFKELLVRNNRTTTDGFITDTMLKNWYFSANMWANAYHKWPFTEGRVQTTFAAGTGDGSDEWNFEGYKADSFRILQIGGKRLTKLNFEDYQIIREYQPTITDRVFTDYGRTIFINPYADVTGTLVAYGQYTPYIDVTDETATTLFSGFDEEGNEAIIKEMQSYLRDRENAIPTIVRGKIISASIAAHQDAVTALDNLWKRISDEQYGYQTSPVRDGWFKRFDVLRGRGMDNNQLNNTNQF